MRTIDAMLNRLLWFLVGVHKLNNGEKYREALHSHEAIGLFANAIKLQSNPLLQSSSPLLSKEACYGPSPDSNRR